MKRVVCVVASLMLLIAASATAAGAVTKTQLRAKALSLSNFPTGWSADNSTSGGAATRPACLQGFKASFKDEVKVSVSYTDGNVPALEETLESGPGINTRYAAFKRKLDSCKGIGFTSGGQAFRGTVGSMSFPSYGNRSSAWAITVTAQRITIGLDLVLFQVGPIAGDVLYEDQGTPDIGQLRAFVMVAINRIEGKGTIPPHTI